MIEIKTVDPETKLLKAYQTAKRTGNLKLSNLSLTDFPESVHRFNTVTIPGDNWWEDIPLTLLDISHNKIP